jgi:hypothetical protein
MGCLDKAIGYCYTNECQMHGLPHTHLIVFLHPDFKLHTPDELNKLLSAEIPDPDTHPELHALVMKYMIHTSCGPDNSNAPCVKNGKCTKGFPKPFREQTTISDDSYATLRHRDTGKTYTLPNGKTVDNRFVVPFCISTSGTSVSPKWE